MTLAIVGRAKPNTFTLETSALVVATGFRPGPGAGFVEQAGNRGPVSSEGRREMFEAVDAVLRRDPEVGAYNQTF